MKRSSRLRIKRYGEAMLREVWAQGSPRQAANAAQALYKIAFFWQDNPHRWIQHTGRRREGGVVKYCNVGYMHSTLFSGPKASHPWRQLAITINDTALDIEENIEALRTVADALNFYASGEKWTTAVKRAFAYNNHLLQVQTARHNKRLEALAIA